MGRNFLNLINKSFGTYTIRGIDIEPTYWEAGAIVFLIFLLILTMARVRYLFIHWSISKPSISMIFWGFLLALILEGFLIIGGRTMLTEVLGWKNAPKPISTVLDVGRSKLVEVLGINKEVPESVAKEAPTYQSVINDFESLSSEDKVVIKDFVCKP